MNQFEYRQFYTRNRPHIHPPGATLFITFRLFGSIPKSVISEYKAKKDWLDKEMDRIEREKNANPSEIIEKQKEQFLDFQRNWFRKFEEILDTAKDSPMWLAETEIRQIVFDKLLEDDGKKYRLDAFCIMSNHVHVVFKPNISEKNLREDQTSKHPKFVSDEETLAKIMQSLKGGTARKANLALNRGGSFWETESYDHFIRTDEEFYRVIKYVLRNPVKAKIVSRWQDWKGTFLAERLQEKFDIL